MPEEEHIVFINKLLEQRNYLSAYLYLKETSVSRETELEYTGRIVQDILGELTYSTGRRNKEKVYFYRSLLLMIFQDIPGLARIYRRQLHIAREPESPLAFLKHLRALTDFSTDKDDLKESIEDTMEEISEKVEDAREDIEEGKLDDSVKDLFSLAEDSIKQGIKGFNEFIKKITKTSTATEPDPENEEQEMRKAEPVEDDIHVEKDINRKKEKKEPGNAEEE
ncbi:MAG: hypothetical protein JXB88_12775 [Spirochaetales bacterium]|nr:hypothetical protein [Spirochaetales bacterium]